MDKLKLENHFKQDTKVLDVYPSNGLFSGALYNRILPEQHILMENRKEFNNWLNDYISTLSEPHTFDLHKLDPYNWKSFLNITDDTKILQPGVESRDHIHSKFLLTGYCCNEGLLMQWLSCLGNQNWIQRFGNVKMLLWVPNSSAIKIMASPSTTNRNKCSVTREAFSNTKVIALPNTKDLKKYDHKLLDVDQPLLIKPDDFSNSKVPLALLEIDPLDHHVNDVFAWDFVVKQMMASKVKPMEESINFLGPAASDFFQQHLSEDIWAKTPRDLTAEEFNEIAKLFELWPFRPRSLVDVIDDTREI